MESSASPRSFGIFSAMPVGREFADTFAETCFPFDALEHIEVYRMLVFPVHCISVPSPPKISFDPLNTRRCRFGRMTGP